MTEKLKAEDIGYRTEIMEMYKVEINKIKTKIDLKGLLKRWEYWLDLPTQQLNEISDENFDRLLMGIKLERKGEFSMPKVGEDFHNQKLSPLLMPEKLVHLCMLAAKYAVPDGCIFNRLYEVGHIKLLDGGNFEFVK